MTVNVIVFGHSFVRRLNDLLLSEVELYNMGLNTTQFSVKCIGMGGLRLSHRRRLHSADRILTGQDFVIVDIGSNDLCDSNTIPEQFALDIVSYCCFLVTGLDVKRVAISQILPRLIEPFPGYNENVIRANVTIQDILNTCDYPVVMWKHRGMWNSQKAIHCADGVHLSLDVGYPKYIRSLRDCIIRQHKHI